MQANNKPILQEERIQTIITCLAKQVMIGDLALTLTRGMSVAVDTNVYNGSKDAHELVLAKAVSVRQEVSYTRSVVVEADFVKKSVIERRPTTHAVGSSTMVSEPTTTERLVLIEQRMADINQEIATVGRKVDSVNTKLDKILELMPKKK